MPRHLVLGLKLSAFVLLGLSLTTALLRTLWPDLGWGFLFLFGLQVLLMLATLKLVLSTIWRPSKRWALPKKSGSLPRRIFAKKTSIVSTVRSWPMQIKRGVLSVAQRLFKRPKT